MLVRPLALVLAPRECPRLWCGGAGGPWVTLAKGPPAHGLPTEGAALPHAKLVACDGLADWVWMRQRVLAWAGRHKIKIQNLSWALGSLSGVSGTGAVRVLPAKIWAGHSDHFRVCRGLERRGRCPRGSSEARAPTLPLLPAERRKPPTYCGLRIRLLVSRG